MSQNSNIPPVGKVGSGHGKAGGVGLASVNTHDNYDPKRIKIFGPRDNVQLPPDGIIRFS